MDGRHVSLQLLLPEPNPSWEVTSHGAATLPAAPPGVLFAPVQLLVPLESFSLTSNEEENYFSVVLGTKKPSKAELCVRRGEPWMLDIGSSFHSKTEC